MDSRDLIIIAVVGFGGWLLWQHYKAGPIPVANASSGLSSMVAGAAAQTVTGGGFTRGLFVGGGTPIIRPTIGTAAFTSTARLLTIEATPPPVALTPVEQSSPSLGLRPTTGYQPSAQLSPLVNPSPLGLRGVY